MREEERTAHRIPTDPKISPPRNTRKILFFIGIDSGPQAVDDSGSPRNRALLESGDRAFDVVRKPDDFERGQNRLQS